MQLLQCVGLWKGIHVQARRSDRRRRSVSKLAGCCTFQHQSLARKPGLFDTIVNRPDVLRSRCSIRWRNWLARSTSVLMVPRLRHRRWLPRRPSAARLIRPGRAPFPALDEQVVGRYRDRRDLGSLIHRYSGTELVPIADAITKAPLPDCHRQPNGESFLRRRGVRSPSPVSSASPVARCQARTAPSR